MTQREEVITITLAADVVRRGDGLLIEVEANHPIVVPWVHCPECGSAVELEIQTWGTDDGEPHDALVGCYDDSRYNDAAAYLPDLGPSEHGYNQSDWQDVRDEAERWARQALRVRRGP